MGKLLGVVMDPIASVNFEKDTTLVLLLAAQKHGYEIFYMEQADLYLDNSEPYAKMGRLKVYDHPEKWFDLEKSSPQHLSQLDVILMRKDPPFDSEFIYSTYILEAAERLGTLIINRPQSLRDCNEKVFATHFPQCTPPLIVSRDQALLSAFLEDHEEVVYKPLDGMGGTSIFRVKRGDQNLNVILETLTADGKNTIMAQKYLPEITSGDKRILVVDGVVIPYCLARIPPKGEFRGNLAVGGTGLVKPLSERDLWIAEQVSPVLKEKGLIFVGLDVIGDYLTEINVTSPTCVREIDKLHNTAIGETLMEAIEVRLG
ncbi:MAG: glutathione synthase [Porticoccaceae bacterium]|jgi:glutathione synthase|nr:glutathione synthase [Porticoccaceae bacterium]|tara:strand:+ start:46 stop:993 length:948 start_codon:yes stop_codon:yes gene_type:complete